MKYEFDVELSRVCKQTFKVVVDAEEPGEALDFCYEVMSSHPETDLVVDRLLLVSQDFEPPEEVTVNFAQTPVDEPDNDIDEGPQYA